MNALLLTATERAVCSQLASQPLDRIPLPTVQVLCRQASASFRRPQFARVYAGVALARCGRLVDAGNLLLSGRPDRFSEAVALRLLSQPRGSVPITSVWHDIGAFDRWTRTPFAIRQQSLTTKAISQLLAASTSRPASPIPTIIDVGTGNGILIARVVNNLAAAGYITRARIVLIDILDTALEVAVANCRRLVPIPIELELVKSPVELLSTTDLVQFSGGAAWLANCAACLHHLPREQKVETIRTLGQSAQTVSISEIEGNHDLPTGGAPDLVYSVWRFYACLVDDLMECDMALADKRQCLEHLLVPEALAILFNDYSHRLNYHMLRSQWIRIARSAGCTPIFAKSQAVQPAGPRTITIGLTKGE